MGRNGFSYRMSLNDRFIKNEGAYYKLKNGEKSLLANERYNQKCDRR